MKKLMMATAATALMAGRCSTAQQSHLYAATAHVSTAVQQLLRQSV